MIGWLLTLGSQGAIPDDAVADRDGGRWYVGGETIDRDVPLVLEVDGLLLLAPAWQVEAVLDCRHAEGLGPDGVICDVEDAAVRVQTFDRWQRAVDRLTVETMLDRVRTQILAFPIWLRIRDGAVDVPVRQPDSTNLAVTLLDRAIDGFRLEPPPGGWREGAGWRTTREPLLDVVLPTGVRPPDSAWHDLVVAGQRWTVRTKGAVEPFEMELPRASIDFQTTEWRIDPVEGTLAIARAYGVVGPRGLPGQPLSGRRRSARLSMHATADLDPVDHHLVRREWTVTGTGAALSVRTGRILRLAPDEAVGLGATGQVGDSRGRRTGETVWVGIPMWEPLLGRAP